MMSVRRRALLENGPFWAWLMLLIGLGATVGGNLGHLFRGGWTVDPFSIGLALFPPVALFVIIKAVSWGGWGNRLSHRALRWGGALPVAALAFYVSWWHISSLMLDVGYTDPVVLVLYPVAMDGLMLVGLGILMAVRELERRNRSEPLRPVTAPPTSAASVGGVFNGVGSGAVYSSSGRR